MSSIGSIHIVYKGHFPQGMASTVRCQNYIKAFKSVGYDVEVIIPIPMLKYDETNYKITKSGYYEGCTYTYMTGSNRRSKYHILRPFVDIYGFFITLCYILFRIPKGDIVYAWVGGWLWFLLVGLVSRVKGCRLYMELNEIPYGNGDTNKEFKFRKFLLFHLAYPLYNGFFVISEELGKEVGRYKSDSANILKVPIIVDSIIANKVYEDIQGPYLFHSGTLSEKKDGLSGMLEAFAIAKKAFPKLKYYMTGNLESSPCKDLYKQNIDKYEFGDDLVFLGYLSDEEMHRYQQHASLMIINKYPTIQNKYCFSTKLGEYLSFSKPVIITNVGEATNFIKDGINGFIVEPGYPELIAEKIIEILSNTSESNVIGKNAFLLASTEFSYEYQGHRMREFFNNK